PPGPCRLCGSEKHWNRECPNYVLYREGAKRSVNFSSRAEPTEEDLMYDNTFTVLLNQTLANDMTIRKDSLNTAKQDYAPSELSPSLEQLAPDNQNDSRSAPLSKKSQPLQPASLEEIEDEDKATYAAKPKSETGILEQVYGDGPSSPEESPTLPPQAREAFSTTSKIGSKSGLLEDDDLGSKPEQTEPLPSLLSPVRLPKRRAAALGRSALGVSVLSMRGSVGSSDNELIDLRLDTCADITLISQEYYSSLDKPPPIKEGIPMKLLQLTQEEEGIKGYTVVPIFMMSEEGELIETEAKAYVVPGMSVPILLGEDYQMNYEIALTRNVESGSPVHFKNWEYTVRAQNVERTLRKRRLKEKSTRERLTLRASRDYRIRPHECRSILAEGYFDDDREWLVEKSLLANANDSYFAVPNVLISSLNPWVPICNPTDQPCIIRKGEAIGSLVDPQEFFDKPRTDVRRQKFAQSAEALAQVI
ncbi:hypothetical protein C8R44DRAFT_563634, partial [Mycena epipterygia]